MPQKTAHLEPLNGVDLRETSVDESHWAIECPPKGVDPPQTDVADIDVMLDTLAIYSSVEEVVGMLTNELVRSVMQRATVRYPDKLLRLEPLPNNAAQDIYTVAVKSAKLEVAGGPGSLEWQTVAQGTLPELLNKLESDL